MKKFMLSLLMIIASLSFILFLTGFVLGTQDILYPQGSDMPTLHVDDQREPSKIEGKLQIVGLGDSLTRGVGDGQGLGYLGRLQKILNTEYQQELVFSNLAVSGAQTADLIEQLQNKGVQYTLAPADVILLTIGGNDLNPGWDKLDKVDLRSYRGNVDLFIANAKRVLHEIRQINQEGQIYWLGLYNPFEDIAELGLLARENVLRWNSVLEELTLEYDNLFIIPVYDLFQQQSRTLLSSDHFHPNEQGYQLMTERLLQKLVLQLGLGQERVDDGQR